MSNQKIDCPVTFQEEDLKFGTFANAFRVVHESGLECFLDFCVYSASAGEAQVVARVRIHRSFLPIMQERLASEMQMLQTDTLVFMPGDGVGEA